MNSDCPETFVDTSVESNIRKTYVRHLDLTRGGAIIPETPLVDLFDLFCTVIKGNPWLLFRPLNDRCSNYSIETYAIF